MSQTYQQRLATVENALAADRIAPAKGRTLTETAA